MLKGHFAEASFPGQVLLILLLIFSGMLLFTMVGVGLAAAIYQMSPLEIIESFSLLAEGGGREVFKLVQGFNTIGMYLMPALVGAYLLSHEPARFIGTTSFPKPAWLIGIALVLAAYSMGAMSDLLYRLSILLPWPESISSSFEASQEIMLGTYENILAMEGAMDFLEVLVIMAVLPAVAEESLFRGLIQPLLRKRLNPHLAIFISSAIFALLHQQYLAFFSIFILGSLLGYLREWSGSIWPSTILHFLNNASIVVMVYFFDYDYRESLQGDQGPNWLETIVLLAILASSVLLMERLFRKKRVLD